MARKKQPGVRVPGLDKRELEREERRSMEECYHIDLSTILIPVEDQNTDVHTVNVATDLLMARDARGEFTDYDLDSQLERSASLYMFWASKYEEASMRLREIEENYKIWYLKQRTEAKARMEGKSTLDDIEAEVILNNVVVDERGAERIISKKAYLSAPDQYKLLYYSYDKYQEFQARIIRLKYQVGVLDKLCQSHLNRGMHLQSLGKRRDARRHPTSVHE